MLGLWIWWFGALICSVCHSMTKVLTFYNLLLGMFLKDNHELLFYFKTWKVGNYMY